MDNEFWNFPCKEQVVLLTAGSCKTSININCMGPSPGKDSEQIEVLMTSAYLQYCVLTCDCILLTMHIV